MNFARFSNKIKHYNNEPSVILNTTKLSLQSNKIGTLLLNSTFRLYTEIYGFSSRQYNSSGLPNAN